MSNSEITERDQHIADLISPCRPNGQAKLQKIFEDGAPLRICRGLQFLIESYLFQKRMWEDDEDTLLDPTASLFFASQKFAYTESYGITAKHIDAIENILMNKHKEDPLLQRRIEALLHEVRSGINSVPNPGGRHPDHIFVEPAEELHVSLR